MTFKTSIYIDLSRSSAHIKEMPVVFTKVDSQTHNTQECLRSLNLLAHAQIIELDIGSVCGGHGKCGKDIIQLPESDRKKVNLPTEIERIHLTAQQLEEGYRLACQCFPNIDGDSMIVKFL